MLTWRFFSRSISACSAMSSQHCHGGPGLGRGFGRANLDHAQLALGHVAELDLLDGHSLAGAPMDGLVDGAECALAQALSQTL